MVKKLLALLLVLILVASLIGCGEKKIDTTAWKDMEITVGGYRNFQEDPKAPGIRIAADKFTETYGTKINFMAAGGDGLGDDIVAAMVAGDPGKFSLYGAFQYFLLRSMKIFILLLQNMLISRMKELTKNLWTQHYGKAIITV